MTLVRFGDLVLESEVPLPSLPPAETSRSDCTLTVDASTGVDPHRWDHHWRRPEGSVSCSRGSPAGYQLGFPGLAVFDIADDGRSIVGRTEGTLPLSTVEHLVVDQVLPRVLAQRGRLVLHAGCVVTARGAVAFLGDSGAGKSTLCASFARAGDGLVLGDDGIVVRECVDGASVAFAT